MRRSLVLAFLALGLSALPFALARAGDHPNPPPKKDQASEEELHALEVRWKEACEAGREDEAHKLGARIEEIQAARQRAAKEAIAVKEKKVAEDRRDADVVALKAKAQELRRALAEAKEQGAERRQAELIAALESVEKHLQAAKEKSGAKEHGREVHHYKEIEFRPADDVEARVRKIHEAARLLHAAGLPDRAHAVEEEGARVLAQARAHHPDRPVGDAALVEEVRALREQVMAMRRELNQVREMLARAAAK